MRKESREFLENLLSTPSPSGYEPAAQQIWCEYARKYADEVRTDAYGNAVAILNPKGDPKLMLDGHVDEIGLMIKHIDDKGFIYFQRIGGVDPALAVVGEVGLSGELRAVSQVDRRVKEAARLGFKRCLIPKMGSKITAKDIELIPAATLKEAVRVGLVGGKVIKEV